MLKLNLDLDLRCAYSEMRCICACFRNRNALPLLTATRNNRYNIFRHQVQMHQFSE